MCRTVKKPSNVLELLGKSKNAMYRSMYRMYRMPRNSRKAMRGSNVQKTPNFL